MTITTDEKDWRQLCALAAVEADPRRLLELIDQLTKALDEHRNEIRGRGRDDVDSGVGASGK